MSAAAALLLLLAGCGADEETEAPSDSADQTMTETTTSRTGTSAEPTTMPPTTSSTVATTITPGAGAMLTWSQPFRVEDAPLDSPAAGSDAGIVVVKATPREEGIEAATEVWFSPDARDWDLVELITGVRLHSVVATRDGFVAVGRADSTDLGPPTQAGRLPEPVPAVWTSDDGRTWSAAPNVDHAPFAYGRMTDVVDDGAGLVAVGEVWDASGAVRPTVWSSPAGLTWTLVPDDPLGTVDDAVTMQVAAGRGGLVAIGQLLPADRDALGPTLAWWSQDGERWEQAPDIPSFAGDGVLLGDLVAFGSGFALVGSQGAQVPVVWYSPDGRTWNDPTPLPTRPDTGSSIVDGVATDGTLLVVVGDDVIFDEGGGPATGDAAIWMSADAVGWIQVPPEQLRGDAVLDAVAARSALVTGADWVVLGTTWAYGDDERAGLVWFGG